MSSDIKINHDLAIPLAELQFRFSRSSGPGGQNVNRTATRVELLFDVDNSPSLTLEQRALIRRRLGGYIDKEGILHLHSQDSSSQWRNREDVLNRLRTLLEQGLRVYRRRIPSHPSRSAKESRLEQKRRRSSLKKHRRMTPKDWS